MYKTHTLSTYPFIKKKNTHWLLLSVLWIYWRKSHHSVRFSCCFWPYNLLPAHVFPFQTPHRGKNDLSKGSMQGFSGHQYCFIVFYYERLQFYCALPVCVCLCLHACTVYSMCSQVKRGEFGCSATWPVSWDLYLKWFGGIFSRSEFIRPLWGGWVCLRKPCEVLHCLKTQL